ncbi:hypothetical protein PR048_017773 [Dryococelus australis]|uniref:MADF domain-containing protein n=1 Tax=Dryococelus australis TaxID=614101 RepID=A0ABQ9HAE2_9NEOP|nr:hypothetical protein PR048_017773 [Dryococelus australis]
MMFDVDKFTEYIHEKPTLWGKSAKEYSDQQCRGKSWIEIGEIICEDWLELELRVRDEKENEMKKKWCQIRYNYQQFLDKGKSGDVAQKMEYVYVEALTFLKSAVQKRKTRGNNADEEENVEDDMVQDDSDEVITLKDAVGGDVASTLPLRKVQQTRHTPHGRSYLTLFKR